ncbi:unnamed protein product, partial [Oikopleura dioica]
IWSRQGRFRW